jgi:hypothetical protein
MYDLYYGGCEELKTQQEKYGTEKVPHRGMSAIRIALERLGIKARRRVDLVPKQVRS